MVPGWHKVVICQSPVTHSESNTQRVYKLIALCTECLSISLWFWGFWVSIWIVQGLLKLRLKPNTKPEVLSERIMGTFPNSYIKPQREYIKKKKHRKKKSSKKEKKNSPWIDKQNTCFSFDLMGSTRREAPEDRSTNTWWGVSKKHEDE